MFEDGIVGVLQLRHNLLKYGLSLCVPISRVEKYHSYSVYVFNINYSIKHIVYFICTPIDLHTIVAFTDIWASLFSNQIDVEGRTYYLSNIKLQNIHRCQTFLSYTCILSKQLSRKTRHTSRQRFDKWEFCYLYS